MVPTLSFISENPTKPVFSAYNPAQSVENNSIDPAWPYTMDTDTGDRAPSPISILRSSFTPIYSTPGPQSCFFCLR